MPGDSGVLVVTRVRSTNKSAHEAAGALGIRHSPRPLRGGSFINGSGAWRGEGVSVCLKLFWLFESFGPSCPDLIRASIHLRNKFFSKMDHRVKPGDDDLERSYFGCSFSAAELMQ
jgi:hypothetical protein